MNNYVYCSSHYHAVSYTIPRDTKLSMMEVMWYSLCSEESRSHRRLENTEDVDKSGSRPVNFYSTSSLLLDFQFRARRASYI